MSILKRIIVAFPGGKKLAERHSYWRRRRKLEKIGDTKDRFTHIYTTNKWKNAESRSGAGSTTAATASIRAALPQLVAELGAKSLLDAPCGDYNWIRRVEWPPGLQYIGGDIVTELVAGNQEKYGSDNVRFVEVNLIEDPLPEADILLCRDCYIHFSFADIERALDNFAASGIRYLLASTYIEEEDNIDIPTGHCRMINLQESPISLPEPIRLLDDATDERPDKRLGLWSREQIAYRRG